VIPQPISAGSSSSYASQFCRSRKNEGEAETWGVGPKAENSRHGGSNTNASLFTLYSDVLVDNRYNEYFPVGLKGKTRAFIINAANSKNIQNALFTAMIKYTVFNSARVVARLVT
jgi:hypothetical protein